MTDSFIAVSSSEKGLTIARKVASRDVVCCSRDEERRNRLRERWPRVRWFIVVGMKRGLIDREKGGLVTN